MHNFGQANEFAPLLQPDLFRISRSLCFSSPWIILLGPWDVPSRPRQSCRSCRSARGTSARREFLRLAGGKWWQVSAGILTLRRFRQYGLALSPFLESTPRRSSCQRRAEKSSFIRHRVYCCLHGTSRGQACIYSAFGFELRGLSLQKPFLAPEKSFLR